MNFLDLTIINWFEVFVDLIVGILVGAERQYNGKPAGIKTSAMICLSTYLFVAMASSEWQIRVMGQIITGVGFLGGGVIISREGVVQGMTSASIIWILAALGALISLGYPWVVIQLTLLILALLYGLTLLENSFKSLQKGVHTRSNLDK